MAKIYHYNSQTLEYIGETSAKLDPRETAIQKKDIFLVPANATTVAPPSTGVEEIAVFDLDAETWSKKIDARGTWWNTEDGTVKIEIKNIGEAKASRMIDVAPPIDMVKPVWDTSNNEWKETSLFYDGVWVATKEDVNKRIRLRLQYAGENKAKTELLIALANGNPVPQSWTDFLAARTTIIDNANVFILNNGLT